MVDRYAVAFEYFGNTVPLLCIFQRSFRVVFHNGDMLRHRHHSLSGSVSFVGPVLSLRTVHCHLVSVTTRPAAVPCRGRAVGGVRRPADGFTQRIAYGRGQVIFIQRHRAPRFVREKPAPVFRPLQVWPSQKAASAWKTASAPGRMARWLQWGGIRRR